MTSPRILVLVLVGGTAVACDRGNVAAPSPASPAHARGTDRGSDRSSDRDRHGESVGAVRAGEPSEARRDAAVRTDAAADVPVDVDAHRVDAARDHTVGDHAVGPAPLTAVPNVFEAGAARPTIDRPVAANLAADARIEVRFEVVTGTYRTRSASYQTLTGVLRAPLLGIERRIGGSAAPTTCESRVEAGERAMFFRCAGDVEDAHGRVWIEGGRLMLVSASSRESARPSGVPDGTIERFALPDGASVRFRAGRGSLGM